MHKLAFFLSLLALSPCKEVSGASVPVAQGSSLEVPSLDRYTATNSSLSNDGPQDVEVKPSNWGQELRPIACLINAVQMIGELALEDYEGTIDHSRLFRYPEYPEVFFGVISIEGIPLPRSVLLWGISKALTVQNAHFQEARFGLVLKRRYVGWLYFRRKELPTPSSSLSAGTPYQTGQQLNANDLVASSPVSVGNVTSLTAAPLKLGMTPLPLMLPEGAVITAVVVGLIQVAPFKRTDIVDRDMHLDVRPMHTVVAFERAFPLRKRPPYFMYEHLIKALTQAPLYMAIMNRFGELRIELEVGHSVVGIGYILKMTNQPEDGASRAVS